MATKATALRKLEEAKQELNNIEDKPLEEQVLFLIAKFDKLQRIVIAGIAIVIIVNLILFFTTYAAL